ncbi:MAG: hypothetical protein DRR04_12330, partial [Gammaproteobacteria bacterium]
PTDALFRAGRATAWEIGPEKAFKFFDKLPVAGGVKDWLMQGAREAVGESTTSALNIADEVLMQGHEFEGVEDTLKRIGYEGSLGAGMGLGLGAGALARKKGELPTDDVPRETSEQDALPGEQLDLGLDVPIGALPKLGERPVLGVDGSTRRPIGTDPEQLQLGLEPVSRETSPGSPGPTLGPDMPPAPNPAIAAGTATMEASLNADPNIPDAADALETPNEEQQKGMFEQAKEKMEAEQRSLIPEGNIQEEEINRNDMTVVGAETLGSLPNVSSQDAAAIDARLQTTVPDPETRQIAVEGLLEQLNDARNETPEASVESVLGNVLPKPKPATRIPETETTVTPEPVVEAAPEPVVEAAPEPVVEAAPEDVGTNDDAEWSALVMADPDTAFSILVDEYGYSAQEADAEIEEIMVDSGLMPPANEAEAAHAVDTAKVRQEAREGKPGPMRKVRQPATGQQELATTRAQPARNDFEERTKKYDADQKSGKIDGESLDSGYRTVVAEPGDVLDLVHGTGSDFSLHQVEILKGDVATVSQDAEGMPIVNMDARVPGLWFTANESSGDSYSKLDPEGGRPRRFVARAIPKNPKTIPFDPDWSGNLNDFHEEVRQAAADGHDMVIFTGIPDGFGVDGVGKPGRKSTDSPKQGVAGFNNYYVVLDADVLSHRPGRDTLRLSEAELSQLDQTDYGPAPEQGELVLPEPKGMFAKAKAKKTTKKKVTKKKVAKKKTSKRKAKKAPAPTVIEAPEETETVEPTEPEPTPAESREPDQRPAKPEEVKDEEKPAVEASDTVLRGIPTEGQSQTDSSPESSDENSQAKIEETDEKLKDRSPDDSTNPDDMPGDREASEAYTNSAVQEVVHMHSGKWADVWYYWVANTSFMGLDKKAAKHHQAQSFGESTARGDVAAQKQYRADLKAWKIKKAQVTKAHKRDPGGVIPFTDPAPIPPTKRTGRSQDPGEFNSDEFKELFRRAKGRAKVWWMERMVDQHYAVKLINDVMRHNGYVHDTVDLYEALTRVGSAVDVKIKKFHGNQQAKMEEAAEKAGMSFDELNDFATALHSLTRNDYVYNRNIQEAGLSLQQKDDVPGYSGMSNNEAHAELVALEAKHKEAGTLKELHALEDTIFATTQFLRETMAGGKLSSEGQQANWNPDGGGTTTGGKTIHERYKELRKKSYADALNLDNYDLTNIDPKEVDPEQYDFIDDDAAKRATLTDKLHNITYVPLSDIPQDTVAEVVRQQLQAKAGANFYSEYSVYGDDISRAYGRQEVGRAKSSVTHLLSHAQQAIIRSDHNIEHSQRIRNLVTALNDPTFGMALPTRSEAYYSNPDNILEQVRITAQNAGVPVPTLTTADVSLLTFHM